MQKFILIIGNARSGSSLTGAVLNAHPQVMIGNETAASQCFWRGLNRNQILEEITENVRLHSDTGRTSGGYSYAIQENYSKSEIKVMGDKIWNPATLLLHGKYDLISHLESTLGVPVVVIHAMRNPYDVIATMHRRSKAPVSDRIRWYFMHAEAAEAIRAHTPESRFFDLALEDVIARPESTIEALCHLLDVSVIREHIAACKRLLFDEPKQTRHSIEWKHNWRDDIANRLQAFPILQRYSFDE